MKLKLMSNAECTLVVAALEFTHNEDRYAGGNLRQKLCDFGEALLLEESVVTSFQIGKPHRYPTKEEINALVDKALAFTLRVTKAENLRDK